MTAPPASSPRPAATVLLLRDSDRGLEVFMERRHLRSGFVGGAYVFPGGTVDPEDHFDESLCIGIDEEGASRILELDHGGLAYWVAAIRECFEESGVLLAYDATGRLLDFSDSTVEERYRDLRQRLYDGELTLEALAREHGLRLATDRVAYWSHWVTPVGEGRRYDTRFFAAQSPSLQTAEHDDHELTDSAWVTPLEALDRGADRDWFIIFPTVKTLLRLAEFRTAEEALTWARSPREILRNQPKVDLTPDPPRIVLPDDPAYADAQEDIRSVDPRTWFAWADEYRARRSEGWPER